MQAVDVLLLARDHDVQVELYGDRLRMTAPRKPPDDLLAELRQHKAEIVAFLSRTQGWTAAAAIKAGRQFEFVSGKLSAAAASPAESGKPSPFDAADYRMLFDERVAILEFDGGLTRSDAETKAIEYCVTEWLNRHPSSSPAGHCVWCSNPESAGAGVVPFGVGERHTWLHPHCWPAWYRRRRADALAALGSLGIPVPMAAPPYERNTPGESR
jgi:hypothetical protein